MNIVKLLNFKYVLRNKERIIPYLEFQKDNFKMGFLSFMANNGMPIGKNHKELSKLKNCHVGKIGYLIGNGPSVRAEDLEMIKDKVTFCCNRFYLAYDMMSFRPMYTVSADQQMIDDFGNEIVEKSNGTVFLCAQRKPEIKGGFLWLRLLNKPIQGANPNVYKNICHTGATLLAALQIGHFMGIRRFVLYGVDHKFQYNTVNLDDACRLAHGEGNHFIKNYRNGQHWAPPKVELIEESFCTYDKLLRNEGGWIKNGTRGGNLGVLERTSFSE